MEAAEESGAEEPDPSEFGIWVPGIPVLATDALESAQVAPWVQSLVVDGVIAGVGAILGFVPQMIVLFAFLCFLEDCGYMARVAFVMDRIFRQLWPLGQVASSPCSSRSGCGVPGVMATKTIENESERRMTIMTTTFVPCGAKMPIIALLIGGALIGDADTLDGTGLLLHGRRRHHRLGHHAQKDPLVRRGRQPRS